MRLTPDRAERNKKLALVLCTSVLLAFAACDDEPVSEHVNLEMLDDGAAVVTLDVTIDQAAYDGPEKISANVSQYALSLVDHTDAWAQRFSEVAADREIERSEKENGRLVRYTRSATVPARDVARFFADSSLTVTETSGPEWRELSIVPGESHRATRDVRRYVENSLDKWSHAIAEYVNATNDLYRYLDAQPQRAEALLGHVFFENLTDEERNRIGEISDEEEPYVGRIRRAMKTAAALGEMEPGDAALMNIAARLVYDPFPAALTVTRPKNVVEVEGFRETSDSVYEVPRQSIWEVLLSFENRWTEPELLTTLIDATQDPPKPIDLVALASRPRRSTAALTPQDVRMAIEKELRPAGSYRIRWAVE